MTSKAPRTFVSAPLAVYAGILVFVASAPLGCADEPFDDGESVVLRAALAPPADASSTLDETSVEVEVEVDLAQVELCVADGESCWTPEADDLFELDPDALGGAELCTVLDDLYCCWRIEEGTVELETLGAGHCAPIAQVPGMANVKASSPPPQGGTTKTQRPVIDEVYNRDRPGEGPDASDPSNPGQVDLGGYQETEPETKPSEHEDPSIAD